MAKKKNWFALVELFITKLVRLYSAGIYDKASEQIRHSRKTTKVITLSEKIQTLSQTFL